MKLEAINAMAQLIAAIGVIASLFYLAAQIRQNTRSMRAMVVDSLAESIADLIRPMAEDRDLMRAFHAPALVELLGRLCALADSETRNALLRSEP